MKRLKRKKKVVQKKASHLGLKDKVSGPDQIQIRFNIHWHTMSMCMYDILDFFFNHANDILKKINK